MWPVPSDYDEAIQNPRLNFIDNELRAGRTELDVFDSPIVFSGNFATVYMVHTPTRKTAVRCFIREVHDHQERYAAISKELARLRLPYIVDFAYVQNGIKVNDTWFPIVKMDWVDGDLLDQYIHRNLVHPEKLRALAQSWLDMSRWLRSAGMAHGDLQHGNVMVVDDHLKLIDYDGMFVPQLAGRDSNETGIEHYQHPGRGASHFGSYLDNFSDWVIYTTLVALSVDKYLWTKVDIEDKHLLFTKDDFAKPAESDTFKRLKNHTNPQLRQLASSLENCLTYPVASVPELNPDVEILPAATQSRISMPDPSVLLDRVQGLRTPIAEGLRKTGDMVGGMVKSAAKSATPPPPEASRTTMRLPAAYQSRTWSEGPGLQGTPFYANKVYISVAACVVVGLLAVALFVMRPSSGGSGGGGASTSALAKKGDEFLRKSDFTQAVKAYSEALESDVSDFGARIGRGQAYLKLGKDKEAFNDFDNAVLTKPNDSRAYLGRGDAARALGRILEARADYDKAISLDSASGEAFAHRGALSRRLGQLSQALSDYSRALELDPSLERAYIGRGNTLLKLGQSARAVNDFKSAIALSPDDAKPYNNRALAYYQQRDYTSAIADFSKAISLAPKDADLYYNRSAAYRESGQSALAMADLDRAAKLYPPKDAHRAALYSSRGSVRGNSNDYRGAIADYKEASYADPDYAPAYLGSALAHHRLGDYQQAISGYDQAAKLAPSDPTVYLARALVYKDRKEYSQAVADLSKAAELYQKRGDKKSAEKAMAAIREIVGH